MRIARSVAVAGVVGVVAAGLFLACVGDDPAPLGPDTADDSSVGSEANANMDAATDSGLAADAAPSLGCPLGCLPPAPAGWTGPSAVYDGPTASKPTSCPTTYLQKELEAFQGVTAPPAACACGAPTFAGAGCSASVVVYMGAGCTGGAFLEGTATNTSPCVVLDNSGYLKVLAPDLNRGTCSFGSPTTTLVDAGSTTTDLSCGLPQNAVCTGDPACVATPVPDAPFSRLCIHQTGEAACPSADYSQRFVAFTSVTDSRSCSACNGVTTGGACGTAWGTSASLAACQLTPPSSMATGTCMTNIQGINTPVGASIAPSGIGCAIDGGAPDGSVDAGDPVTFCCNK